MLNLLTDADPVVTFGNLGKMPPYESGPRPWPQEHYVLKHADISIVPTRPHAFRLHLGNHCAACSWPKWHAVHLLRPREYPAKGAGVRLLSHPSRVQRPYFPRTVCVGMEGIVMSEAPRNYTGADAMFKVFFHAADAVAWVTAGTLLVLS